MIKKCYSPGCYNRAEYKFCITCAYILCAKCLTNNLETAKICYRCGHELDSSHVILTNMERMKIQPKTVIKMPEIIKDYVSSFIEK